PLTVPPLPTPHPMFRITRWLSHRQRLYPECAAPRLCAGSILRPHVCACGAHASGTARAVTTTAWGPLVQSGDDGAGYATAAATPARTAHPGERQGLCGLAAQALRTYHGGAAATARADPWRHTLTTRAVYPSPWPTAVG